MKIPFCFFVLLALTFQNFTCKEECQYEYYWYFTGRATIEYANGNFSECAKHLKEAFSQDVFIWGNDLDLGLKTSVHLQDTLWAQSLSIQLAKGGVPMEYFESFKSYSWYPAFRTDFKAYQRYFEDNFNLEKRKAILAVREMDKKYNSKYHEFRQGTLDLTLEELTNGAREVRDEFTNIIKTYGFPSQKSTGYFYIDSEIRRFPIVIVMTHTFQRGDRFLKQHLSDLVCKGHLRLTDQALLIGFQGYGNSTGIEDEMIIRYDRIMSSRQ